MSATAQPITPTKLGQSAAFPSFAGRLEMGPNLRSEWKNIIEGKLFWELPVESSLSFSLNIESFIYLKA